MYFGIKTDHKFRFSRNLGVSVVHTSRICIYICRERHIIKREKGIANVLPFFRNDSPAKLRRLFARTKEKAESFATLFILLRENNDAPRAAAFRERTTLGIPESALCDALMAVPINLISARYRKP